MLLNFFAIYNTKLLQLQQIKEVLKYQKKENILDFVEKFCLHIDNITVGVAAGRMGYSLRAFILRLSHMRYNSYMIRVSNLPKIWKNDIIIINSSSGNTPKKVIYAQQAKEVKSLIFAIIIGKRSIIDRLLGSLQVDILKTLQKLDWSPLISINEGLRHYYVKQNTR